MRRACEHFMGTANLFEREDRADLRRQFSAFEEL
jgi:hypothetical protein